MMPHPLITTLDRSGIRAVKRVAEKLSEKAWTDEERKKGRTVSWDLVPTEHWPALKAYFRACGWKVKVPHKITKKAIGVDRASFRPAKYL